MAAFSSALTAWAYPECISPVTFCSSFSSITSTLGGGVKVSRCQALRIGSLLLAACRFRLDRPPTRLQADQRQSIPVLCLQDPAETSSSIVPACPNSDISCPLAHTPSETSTELLRGPLDPSTTTPFHANVDDSVSLTRTCRFRR